MQILFIDESGTIPPKDKSQDVDCFVLGGVVVPEDMWFVLSKELAQLKASYKIHGEIKWRYFIQGKEGKITNNPLSHLTGHEKNQLRNKIYELVTKCKSVRLICAVVDIKKAYSLGTIQDHNDLYGAAYKVITERFQYYLQDLSRLVGQKIHGIVVCDHRQKQDDHYLHHLHQQLVAGTNSDYCSNYKNIIECVFIAPSHMSIGVQFADMIGGAVFRKYARNDGRFFEQIESSFRRSSDGKLEGYGLIYWPKN